MATLAIWKAAAFGCFIHGHNFTLDRPAQIDGSGCKMIRIEDNYIEVNRDVGPVIPLGKSWALRYDWSAEKSPPVSVAFNFIAHLHGDRTPYPGLNRSCSDGYSVNVRHDGDKNLYLTCMKK